MTRISKQRGAASPRRGRLTPVGGAASPSHGRFTPVAEHPPRPWEMFGHSADAAVQTACARDLTCVEFFSGVGSIWRAFVHGGHQAVGFDYKSSGGVMAGHDLTTQAGFDNALQLLLRIQPGGLAHFAPPCNSWNWLCLYQSGRHSANKWLGHESKEFVAEGNMCANATAFLAHVATLRQVQWTVENPPGSYLWHMFAARGVFTDGFSSVAWRCAFRSPNSTEEILKSYRFLGSHSWTRSLGRQCSCPPSVVHYRTSKDLAGGGRRGDSVVLKASQEYPRLLGTAVFGLWASWAGSAAVVGVPVLAGMRKHVWHDGSRGLKRSECSRPEGAGRGKLTKAHCGSVPDSAVVLNDSSPGSPGLIGNDSSPGSPGLTRRQTRRCRTPSPGLLESDSEGSAALLDSDAEGP